MKNIIYSILGIAFVFTMACDKVEPYEDGTYKQKIEVVQGETIPQIVIFEFTGWDCLNCPDGHKAIEELKDSYGESVKALGIHAGSLTEPAGDNEFDFTNETSKALFERFNKPGEKPSAAVNSMNYDNLSSSVADWADEFANIYGTIADSTTDNAELYLSYTTSISEGEISAQLQGTFNKDLEGNFNLSVYVVQNKIEDMQNVYGKYKPDYEHSHVLRASMHNGIYGEEVGVNPTNGTKFDKSYTLKIEEDWADAGDDFEVVAFVYNTESNLVVSTKIINTKTE